MAKKKKVGRPKIIRTPEQIAQVALRLAQGDSQSEVARDVGCDPATICRFAKAHHETIEALHTASKLVAQKVVLQDLAEALHAQMQAAKDPDCRHGPQALRAATDVAGLTGKAALVHVGDQFNPTVDASQHLHAEFTDEDRAQYEAYQRKHGITGPQRAERLATFKKKHGMA